MIKFIKDKISTFSIKEIDKNKGRYVLKRLGTFAVFLFSLLMIVIKLLVGLLLNYKNFEHQEKLKPKKSKSGEKMDSSIPSLYSWMDPKDR